jgi:triose/dihydroxyacetone kinase / FAD-AMP lyase (cyclizing)
MGVWHYAQERAKAEGLNVKMLIVGDDCALPKKKGITGRRGIAGTILVQKVACAAAAAGLPLDEVSKQ